MSVIVARALEKVYGTTHALRGIDLEIERGGVVGLLGPNGAGKTTLVEICEGLRQPTGGTVRVLGLDPWDNSRRLKERLGVQLQSTSLPTELTVAETIGLFASFYRNARPTDDVLAEVRLTEQAGQLTRTLSGGQKQRLVVGLALIHDPELVLLDEPTTGLDPGARRELHEIVRRLRSQGRTTILTTHYIEEAEQLCDRVIMIRRGRIVADGTPFELLARSHGETTLWIAVDGKLDPAPLLAAGARSLGLQGRHHKFAADDPTSMILALGDLLRGQGLTLVDLRMRRPTLEDVYLELMGEDADGDAEQEAA